MKDRPKPPPRKTVRLPPIGEAVVVPPMSPATRARQKQPPPPVPAAAIREDIEDQHFAMPRLTNLAETDIMDRIKEFCNILPIKTQYKFMVSNLVTVIGDNLKRKGNLISSFNFRSQENYILIIYNL